jgi:hypothetical protein
VPIKKLHDVATLDADTDFVVIQLSSTSKFLYHMEGSGDILPFGYFAFVETTLEEAKNDSSVQFQLETSETTVQLRSLAYGGLVAWPSTALSPRELSPLQWTKQATTRSFKPSTKATLFVSLVQTISTFAS